MSNLLTLSIWVIPLLFAITLHEVAHGWTAWLLGDPTAAELGRLSLNPIKHIDPIGTVLVPIIMLLVLGFAFGWAKPVPVDMHRLRDPKKDMALVALAGPMANLFMALIWASIAKFSMMLTGEVNWMTAVGLVGIFINLILMILNLLPLPPLDGGRVLAGVLPDRMAYLLGRIEPFGLLVILSLFAFGILGRVIMPPTRNLADAIIQLFALPSLF
jgi:Zn-dependent protease